MSQRALRTSADQEQETFDFKQNYRYLKRLLKHSRAEDGDCLRKEIFGEGEAGRNLTKREMKQLFKLLRKIESHYEECRTPPIPTELEDSIRARESDAWLPWELEAIEKVDVWRESLHEKHLAAREMLDEALAQLRQAQK